MTQPIHVSRDMVASGSMIRTSCATTDNDIVIVVAIGCWQLCGCRHGYVFLCCFGNGLQAQSTVGKSRSMFVFSSRDIIPRFDMNRCKKNFSSRQWHRYEVFSGCGIRRNEVRGRSISY